MTEREYEHVLDAVQRAMSLHDDVLTFYDPGEAPAAANDNAIEWPLTPFPEGWHASP